MKKCAAVTFVMFFGIVLAASALAESAKDECVRLCKDAAAFTNEKGLDAAIKEISTKEGKFVSKNTYVYLLDMKGTLLAHPFNSKFIGKNLFDQKDTTGKLFVQEQIEIAKIKGEGWSEYMYPTPEELKKPTPFKDKVSSRKLSFVYRVPGKDILAVAGIFE